jgi:hypothetical protein
MGWNNGANSNQLYRPEVSRLLTGAPADNVGLSIFFSHMLYEFRVPICPCNVHEVQPSAFISDTRQCNIKIEQHGEKEFVTFVKKYTQDESCAFVVYHSR